MSGIRPTKTLTTSASSRGQIANVLRMPGVEPGVSCLSYSSDLLRGLAWDLIDTGNRPMTWRTIGDEVIHVLHATDEPSCRVEIDDVSMLFAPGDTLRIGSNAMVQLSDGVLALDVHSDRGSPSASDRPSHGVERFAGFNRQTTYGTGTEISLERWKLTVPQTLDLDSGQPAAFVVLYGSVSIVQSGSVETLVPGDSIVFTGDQVRVVPDGLAYIAIIRRPCPLE